MPTKNLFISLSNQHIFCAEKNKDENALIMEKNFEVGYNQHSDQVFFESFNEHGRNYNVVYCALKQPFFVLIPEALYDANNVNDFLPGIDLTNQRIVADKISRNNVMCIYGIDNSVYEKFTHNYPNIILKHYASVLIDYTIKIGFTEQKTVATVDLEDGLFYLCLADKTDLLLCNKFVFKSPEDILYFLLYSLEQFELKPAACQLHICGMVSQNSNALVLLREYFEQVIIEENDIRNAIELKYQTAFFHQDACV
jgi:Protein of unknown function (DUF3822)